MNRIGFVLTAVLAVALLALGSVPAHAALPSLPSVAPAGATTQYMPKDSTIIVALNVQGLAKAGLLDSVKEMGGEELFENFEAMGVDLTKDVTQVMLGVIMNPEDPEEDPEVYCAIAGNLPSEEKFLEVYEQQEGEKPEARQVKDKNVYNIDDEVDLCFLPGVILLVPTEEVEADIAKMLAGAQGSMLGNLTLAGLMKDVNTEATVWAIASLPEALRTAMAEDAEGAPFDVSALETIAGAFDYGETKVDLKVALGFTNADVPKQLVEMFNTQVKPMATQMAEMMPEVATLIGALAMNAADTKAMLTLNMDRAEFESAVQGIVGMMFGGMMGGEEIEFIEEEGEEGGEEIEFIEEEEEEDE